MRFENTDGVQHIILEENDKISLTTEDAFESMSIDIECENCGLNISGNSSLINKISGDGMLEKVLVPPFISSEDIIEKCDEWLEMFRKIHDKFRELVLTDKYRKQDITMRLTFGDVIFFSDRNIKGNQIYLNLVQHGTIIQEGVTISVDENNKSIYNYLLANVLEHYLSVNYAGSTINNTAPGWEMASLSSNDKKQENSTAPILCVMGLNNYHEYASIITSIITNHNLVKSSKEIIDNLKRKIYDQQLSERFSRSITHSNIQFGYIMSDPDSEKAPVLEKRK